MATNEKHIAIPEATKDRLATFIKKSTTWDKGLNILCDFVEKNIDEFEKFRG